uniref:Uncharacterized protein n=1 Tax=Romanomermis culicivorax TaxID=13658 RepID=A0A915HQJ3_ROMCU
MDCISLLWQLGTCLENDPKATVTNFLSNSNNIETLFHIFVDLNHDPRMRRMAAFCLLILSSIESERRLSTRLAQNLGVYLTQFLSLDETFSTLCCLILENLAKSKHQKTRDILFSQNCHLELVSSITSPCASMTELTEDMLRVLFLLISRDGLKNKSKIEWMLQSISNFLMWMIDIIDKPEMPLSIVRPICWILSSMAFHGNFVLSEPMVLRLAKFLERLCKLENRHLDIIIPCQRTFGIYFSSDNVINLSQDFLTTYIEASLTIFQWDYAALHKECLFCWCNVISKVQDDTELVIEREFFCPIIRVMRNSLSQDIIRLGLSLMINLKIKRLLPQLIACQVEDIERVMIDAGRLSSDLCKLFQDVKSNVC